MDQKSKSFENEDFLVEAVWEPGCHLSAKVTVKPKAAMKAYQKGVKIVNKQISVPGFRKGHAPDQTVISRHGSYVEQEWKDLLVNDAYRATLELTNIYPLGKETVDKPKIDSCSKEEGAVVRIAYEYYPEIPTIDFSKLKLPKLVKESVDESKVDEILQEVRTAHADWEPVEGRAIQEGDFVDVTIWSLEEEPPKPLVEERRFEVAEKRLAPWLKTLLLGLNVGESAEGISEVDAEADARVKKNFKPTKVRVTVHAIQKSLLPPIDDQLAQKAGAKSVEDLKEKITHNLDKQAEAQLNDKKIEALDKALLDTYHFDLPASFVEAERAERIARKIQALKNQNVPDDAIKAQEGAIEKEVAGEIDAALRLYFLNKQLVKQGNISLSNQELNDELVRQLTQSPHLFNKGWEDSETRDYVSRLASAMTQRKAKTYALNQIETS